MYRLNQPVVGNVNYVKYTDFLIWLLTLSGWALFIGLYMYWIDI